MHDLGFGFGEAFGCVPMGVARVNGYCKARKEKRREGRKKKKGTGRILGLGLIYFGIF